jgi:hypothetical protein
MIASGARAARSSAEAGLRRDWTRARRAVRRCPRRAPLSQAGPETDRWRSPATKAFDPAVPPARYADPSMPVTATDHPHTPVPAAPPRLLPPGAAGTRRMSAGPRRTPNLPRTRRAEADRPLMWGKGAGHPRTRPPVDRATESPPPAVALPPTLHPAPAGRRRRRHSPPRKRATEAQHYSVSSAASSASASLSKFRHQVTLPSRTLLACQTS